MKRFSLILALAMMTVSTVFAERVTPETARRVAAAFLNNNGAKADQLTDLSKEAGFPNLYIFTTKEGFVLMAADDCVKPILGYSLTNPFVAEGMPENIQGWLQGYNDEIQYAVDNQQKATAETAQLWKDLQNGNANVAKATVIIGPLIETRWDQGSPYNSLCPSSSVTGCVATAMAQVMKFWNYPAHGIGSHSYLPESHPEYGIQTVDFNSTNYDWNNMTNTYSIFSGSTQKKAVATLMYHCGVSVNMDYSPNSSSAVTANVAHALKTYFNYSSEVQHLSRSDYSDAEWISMLKADLDLRRPIQYHGNGDGGGHSFICDGYNSDNYFHFNWGWGGYCDDYYLIDNLNPGPGGIGSGSNGIYNSNQGAIFGIRPSDCIATAPINLTYTQDDCNVTLSWTAANNATSYNIYRNNYYVGNTTSVNYSETAPFGTSVYYVRSVDSNGELSLSSNSINVAVNYHTPVVDDLEATLSNRVASLNWSAPDWCFPETPSATLNYGSEDPYYYWPSVYYAHRHLASDLFQYTGKTVYKVATYIRYPGTYSLFVYTRSTADNQPDANYLAANIDQISISIYKDWHEFVLDTPITLTGTDDLWVVIKQENTEQAFPTPSFNLSEHNINAFYSGSSPTNLRDPNSNYNCAWLINTYLTDGTYTYNLYDGTTLVASHLDNTSYSIENIAGNTLHQYTVKTNYYNGETEASNKACVALGSHTLGSLNLQNDRMIVAENSSLTVSNSLTCIDPEHLVLEDGAQLINNSEDVQAIVKKTIQPYTDGQHDGWNLIASPIIENLNADDVEGLVVNDYDLYFFDQTGGGGNDSEKEWRNYEAEAFATIEPKVGYLYANSGETTLSFTGTLAGTAEDTELSLDATTELAGFNLIGNPYPCNAYLTRPFYVLQYDNDEDRTSFVIGDNDIPISPCSAVLVQAQNNGEIVTFNKNTSSKTAHIDINLSQSHLKNNYVIDQARINFQQNGQLGKYSLDKSVSTVYIPQNGKKLAVVCDNGQHEMPINFNASQNGSYTLSIEAKNLDLNYLRLIDNLTGNEVDLMETASYTFEAKTTDYASRFRLVFHANESDSPSSTSTSDSEDFAFISDGNIIVNQDGILHIVDMTGRSIVCRNDVHSISTNEIAQGVYVLRLITADGTKTQKIVID